MAGGCERSQGVRSGTLGGVVSYRLWCCGGLREAEIFFIVLYSVIDDYTLCGKLGDVKHRNPQENQGKTETLKAEN
jgi:hypothetical protein